MTEITSEAGVTARTPWHIWVVGILALLWNASGAYTIMSAQAGRLPGLDADEAAYYAAQPNWLTAVTDIALLSALAGAVVLLLRSKWAVELFGLSIVAIAVSAGYDLAAGTSRMYANTGALVATLVIWVLAVLQFWYAAAMRRKEVLR